MVAMVDRGSTTHVAYGEAEVDRLAAPVGQRTAARSNTWWLSQQR